MKRFAITLIVLCPVLLRAEVKTEEKDQVQFAGMLGRMMGMFGGKDVREGVVDKVAVKGNRKITLNDTTGRIIDLDEEKIYDLDVKRKTYRVMTFDDLRRQMEQEQERARNSQEKTAQEKTTQPASPPQSDANAKPMQIDFDLKETGQKKNINGYDCREVVTTITVHEKDKTLEQSGGLVMTTHEWLGPQIPALKEIADFDQRYAQKLRGPSFATMPSADQMAAAAAMYPMLSDAIGKFNVENVNMDGAAILISTVTESVASPEQQQQQQQQQNSQQADSSNVPTSVGGLIGGIGRRAIRNRTQRQQQQNTPGRATIMTINHELLKASTDVSAADTAIPAGFKQKN